MNQETLKAIPRPVIDIIFNDLHEVRRMPDQKDLAIGWNTTKSGTYLVTDSINADKPKIRVQFWYIDPRVDIASSLSILDFYTFCDDFLMWMMDTFPIQSVKGKLEHLKKEADEALAKPDDIHEFADCTMLSIGAAYVSGFTPRQLLEAMKRKLLINKSRKWPVQTDPDEPVHHIKE